jgi:hypothetical protein
VVILFCVIYFLSRKAPSVYTYAACSAYESIFCRMFWVVMWFWNCIFDLVSVLGVGIYSYCHNINSKFCSYLLLCSCACMYVYVCMYVRMYVCMWLPAAVSGRQTQTYVKPEAAITVLELLMMSGVSFETC